MAQIRLRDGMPLRYQIVGRGDPIIMLHGFAMQSRHWLPFIYGLSKRHCFILPDFRGHGGSYESLLLCGQNPLLEFCEDIEELTQHLGLKTFRLIGYSLGAAIGLHYITSYGAQRVERYMHIEAGPKFHSDSEWDLGFNEAVVQKAQRMMQLQPFHNYDPHLPLEHLPRDFRRCYREFVWSLAQISWPPGRFGSLVGRLPDLCCQPWLPQWQVATRLFDFLLKQGYDLCSLLETIKIPTSLVAAKHSQFFPQQAIAWMLQHLERGELISFENSGHGLMFSEPLTFANALRRFLEHPNFAHDMADRLAIGSYA